MSSDPREDIWRAIQDSNRAWTSGHPEQTSGEAEGAGRVVWRTQHTLPNA